MEILRKRFADRKVAPPDGLWQGIQEAMSARNAFAGRRGIVRRRYFSSVLPRRIVAVAACLAVLLGAGWLIMRYSVTLPYAPGAGRPVAAVVGSGKPVSGRGCVGVEKRAECQTVFRRSSDVASADTVCPGFSSPEPSVRPVVAEAAGDTSVVNPQADDGTSVRSVVVRQRPSDGKVHGRVKRAGRLLALSDVNVGRGKNLAVSVFGGGMASFGNSSGNGGVALMSSNYVQDDVLYGAVNKDAMLLSAYADSPEPSEVRVRHRQPVKLGMSVRLKLADRLGLETGLNYSYHSSDIASGDESGGYDTDQKLHFMGIPLVANFYIWSKKNVEVYASAGGAVEFCVSGESHTDYMSGNVVVRSVDGDLCDRRPQWSVNASAGVQYNFNDIVGVYAEPGVGYYFDNGSSINTIYKEKPFCFNLNVGFRFTIR